MNAALLLKFQLLLVLHLIFKLQLALAGTCWSAMARNGRCTEILYEKSTKENCCALHRNHQTTAWSADDLDPGHLFFLRVLGGGVPCAPCKDSCKEVDCGADKSCVLKKGHPKCVCSSKCSEGGGGGGNKNRAALKSGPICGTDGRTYRNICRLKKRACRRRTATLALAYAGICQTTCDRISCPLGRHCLLDQNLTPHCVICTRKCMTNRATTTRSRQVCGADGLTYPSACHLREKTCRKGKAIPIAYKGACREGATCQDVRCRDRQLCLNDVESGMPRCVSCISNCRPRHTHHSPICGSNNGTYHSWCEMIKDSCHKGYVIDTKYAGKCAMRI